MLTATAGVHPAPGDSTLARFMRHLQALRSLSFCTRAIAELELIDKPTAYDLQLLERYRAAAARLAREVALVRVK